MHQIYLCFESHTKEVVVWLKTRYEVIIALPQTEYNLCIVDSACFERIVEPIKMIKDKYPQIFMPVILVSTRQDLKKLENRFSGIVDEILLEPVLNTELQLRINGLLQAHDLSRKASKIHESEIKLELQAKRLENLSTNVPGMIYQFAVPSNESPRFEYISNGCKDIFEIEPEHAVKDPLLILKTVHPDERTDFDKNLAEAILQRRTWTWEGRFLIKGKTKWIKAASTPHIETYGLIWDGVMINVTALKETEEKVRNLALYNDQIIENTDEGILVCDKQLRITRWNRSLEIISGISRNEAIGQHPLEFFQFLITKGMHLYFKQALNGIIGETEDYRYEFKASGKKGWAKNRTVPLRNANGETIGMLCTIDEISNRKKAEEDLLRLVDDLQTKNKELNKINIQLDTANDRLKNIDSIKSQFISTASHEIRTPLTSILGFIQTLTAPDINIPEKNRMEYLQLVESETMRLSQLVDSLLNISRLEAGKEELQRSSFSITDLVRSIRDTIHLGKQNITISVVDKYNGQVNGDSQQIEIVIRNILNNAIRYSKPGSTIEITVNRTVQEVIVSVKDHGPGIPKDQLQTIFEKFYRIRKDHTTSGKGSGLGLSIAMEIIKAHKGRIWAESTIGEGSTFFFTLPLGM